MVASSVSAQPSTGATYVAMGSSYAAGPGIGSIDPTSGACARSKSNYATRVAARFHLRLVDVACSGATTRQILDYPQAGFPPQINAVTSDTSLVTVTIGGNDVDYIGNLLGYSCIDTGGSCKVVDDASVGRKFNALPASLRAVIAAIRARAPKARIILVGYLPVVPANPAVSCPAVPLSSTDAIRMRAVAVRLAQAIGYVGRSEKVDVIPASLIGTGHDPCSAQPYTAGYKPTATPGSPRPAAYHPNQAGMDQIAKAIGAKLAG